MNGVELADALAQVDPARLERDVRRLEGPRHPTVAPEALAEAEAFVVDELSAVGLQVSRQPFTLKDISYNNVVGTLQGSEPELPWLLVGAHFDTVSHSPGADDNASGVAAMLEVVRGATALGLRRTIQFVGFNLEEPQDLVGTYRVGSARFTRQARREGRRYQGALVLEMVGYTDRRSGTQQVPPFIFKRVPDSGTFLAAVGDGRSRHLLRAFAGAARRNVPDLAVVTYRTFLRGWALPLTRLSDNASFWDRRYPSLMITDTAFLRNPHYHQMTDRAATLDFEFMAQVARAVLATVAELGGT